MGDKKAHERRLSPLNSHYTVIVSFIYWKTVLLNFSSDALLFCGVKYLLSPCTFPRLLLEDSFLSPRKKWPYSKLFWSACPRIQSECGKMWTRITPNTNSFHIVYGFCHARQNFKFCLQMFFRLKSSANFENTHNLLQFHP